MKFEIENISFIIQILFKTTLHKPRKRNFTSFSYSDREMMTGVIYHLCRFPGAMQLRARAKGTSISNFKKPMAKPSNWIFYFLLSS